MSADCVVSLVLSCLTVSYDWRRDGGQCHLIGAELSDGTSANGLWSWPFGQAWHYIKQHQRANSVALLVNLTYVTLPWHRIIAGEDAVFYGCSQWREVGVSVVVVVATAPAREEGPRNRWRCAFVHRMAKVAVVSFHRERRSS